MIRALVVTCLLAAVATAQPSLGETTFANSGLEDAQEPFLRGVLLLHSFEYDDARDAFKEARQQDPDFVMAAWGEAMTHNHPVWQRQDRDAARAALEGVDVSAASPREQAYLSTLEVLFGDGDKEDRDDAYAAAMARLAEMYPDDLDAHAFHALALLGTAHEGRDFTTYMKAAAVAEEVFEANPRHPGAAHYLIHAYDDPVHAPLGLRPARVYADVAPAASHALHMPSHIYLALGMWEEVAEMNERSFEAAKAGSDRRGQALNGHGWHALWWWHYAATQLDQPQFAYSLRQRAIELAGDDPSPTALSHMRRMRSQEFVAFGDLDALVTDDSDDLLTADNVHDAFVRGLYTVAHGDQQHHRPVLEGFRSWVPADAGWYDQAALLILEGYVLVRENDFEGAEQRFSRAAALEAEAPLTFGPPSPALMANEALGHFLLDQGRSLEAERAFLAALDRAPNRRQAVAGLEAARAAQ